VSPPTPGAQHREAFGSGTGQIQGRNGDPHVAASGTTTAAKGKKCPSASERNLNGPARS